MWNRREFLGSTLAAGVALGAVPALGGEKPVDINASLQSIVDTLRKKQLAYALSHFVDTPKIGLVQWQWPHFKYDLPADAVYPSQSGNHELFGCMDEVRRLPAGHLDELMLEGLVQGKIDTQIQGWKLIHRELIQAILTKVNDGNVPSEEEITRACREESYQFENVRQAVPTYGEERSFNISPLARLGAGYMMHALRGTKLAVAEDPDIDAKAEKAELSPYDRENYERRIFTDRDRHFMKITMESRRKIVHFLVGYSHYLLDDIGVANRNGAGISLLIIKTPSTDRLKRRWPK